MTNAALRRRSEALKRKWPAYAPLLAFYVAVREAQQASKPVIDVNYVADRAFAMHPEETDRFPIDAASAKALFAELCRIGKLANPHFEAQVDRIEAVLRDGSTRLETLITSSDRWVIDQVGEEKGVDPRVLHFLVRNARQPSVERGRDAMLPGIELAAWKQVLCPVCGSKPNLNLFKGDPSQRLSVCSDCSCEWPVDRLRCSVCGKNEKNARAYFNNEGQEAFRIDTCETCQHYIKTIDSSRIGYPDPILEDLATLHLDVIATEKGFKRPVPNRWID